MVSEQNVKFYYIYILRNDLKNFIYIGYSKDLKQRISTHNKGENLSTKAYVPLELIHYEAYKNNKDAKRRELYLKSNKGRTTIITMLKEYFNKGSSKSKRRIPSPVADYVPLRNLLRRVYLKQANIL